MESRILEIRQSNGLKNMKLKVDVLSKFVDIYYVNTLTANSRIKVTFNRKYYQMIVRMVTLLFLVKKKPLKLPLLSFLALVVSSFSFIPIQNLPISTLKHQSLVHLKKTASSGRKVLFNSIVTETESSVHSDSVSIIKGNEIGNSQIREQKYQSTYDWSFLNAVYLITCPDGDGAQERLERTRDTLTKAGLWDKVKVMEFGIDDEDRIRGCYTSHISVLIEAQTFLSSQNKMNDGTNVNNKSDNFVQNIFSTFESYMGTKQHNNGEASSDTGKIPVGKTVPRILVLEDNIELTGNLRQSILQNLDEFSSTSSTSMYDDWDMIHLAYTSLVPNLSVKRFPDSSTSNIVLLESGIGSALGTTAYIISSKGIDCILNEHKNQGGYVEKQAIPDLMAKLFPKSRYAVFPVPFLRAPQTKSLVNPQLDDLRSLLFQPPIYTQIEKLIVFSGLSTNALLPITIVTLLVGAAISTKITADAMYEIFVQGSYTGNLLVPIFCSLFSLFSLAILAQGIALAPKPPQEQEE